MYALDTNAARQADERSGRINEIGKFIGTFSRAEDVTSTKGTRGIDFAFETDDRLSANFSLWTLNAQGESLFGFKQLQAMMACMRVRNIEPVRAVVKKWDRNSSSMVEVEAAVFKELMSKKIGILFETEDYEKNDGSIGTKVVPAAFFDPATELMAAEILDRKVQPLQLAKVVQSLRHRPLKKRNGSPQATSRQSQDNASSGGFDEMDDDIPF
ncbi:hypothetical protein QZM42_33570 [Burkholderia vietnamiensis]|uniref:hypothetical protein n=1 Tax=Burkholderia vietnamiensis TaxID=60552 RepID=UPI002652F146|nr:hypothetical protein [Burkholderia vietnamiensis]MDN7413457.1 hypothetical protein [Burkholderia vietnamiensis]HDR9048799.1 hypothetical protein [Burkholderia vietnamiensis]HDR9231359.1 hypothetical protein [Burkholderia vietnamiensis]